MMQRQSSPEGPPSRCLDPTISVSLWRRVVVKALRIHTALTPCPPGQGNPWTSADPRLLLCCSHCCIPSPHSMNPHHHSIALIDTILYHDSMALINTSITLYHHSPTLLLHHIFTELLCALPCALCITLYHHPRALLCATTLWQYPPPSLCSSTRYHCVLSHNSIPSHFSITLCNHSVPSLHTITLYHPSSQVLPDFSLPVPGQPLPSSIPSASSTPSQFLL